MRFTKLTCVIAGVLSAAAAGSAQAAVVFSDTFDSYAASQVPWNGSGTWSTANSVDLVRSGDYNLTCAGGKGNCVDLSGSSAGSISHDVYLTAGDYSLSFAATGNQLDAFGGPWPKTGFIASIAGLTVNTGLLTNNSTVFQTFSNTFNVASSGTYTLTFAQSPGGNNYRGSILDNVVLSAVPEPGTWLLMIAGFGMMGAVLRRRRQPVLRVSAA